MEKEYMEWYRFKSSKWRTVMTGFSVGFFLTIIIDSILGNFFNISSEKELYYVELLDIGIFIVCLIWAAVYTHIWFSLSEDTLYYVKRGKVKGSYNINDCSFERDYKKVRVIFLQFLFKRITTRIRISVETEQGKRDILKGTGFSAITFDDIFDRIEELRQYDKIGQNGKYLIPQRILKKQITKQSFLHILDSWKTPWKLEFAKGFLVVNKKAYSRSRIKDISIDENRKVRKLILRLEDRKKTYYLGSTEDTLLDISGLQREIQNFMS